MCEAIQQIRINSRLEGEHIGEERGVIRGEKRGEITAKKSAAQNLYTMGLTLDKIAQALDEPLETIKEWLKIN